ncbi:hypothetical protein ACOSQ2_004642 [Xanthoceras sorbifolium]
MHKGVGSAGSSNIKAVKEVISLTSQPAEGFREEGIWKGKGSSGVSDVVAERFRFCLRGFSPTGGRNPPRGGSHWKRRAREEMVVDGGAANSVLTGKKADPFNAEPEFQLVVNCDRRSNGLGLLWKDTIGVDLLSFSRFHIDVKISSHLNKVWHLTGLYSNLELSQKVHGWTLLYRLSSMSSLPWLCRGNFNEIL